MQKINIILLSLILSACATDEPLVRVVTERVEVPVPVQCKTDIPATPIFNVPKLATTDTMFDKTKSYLADEQLRKAYEAELLAALKSCK